MLAGPLGRRASSSSPRTPQRFIAEARKRPEIASVTTTFVADVPQVFADVDRDKVLKQGVALEDVYQTLQAFMGGVFINYFNRFGRTWQVYVQAEGEFRTRAENVGQFYVLERARATTVPLSARGRRWSRRAGPSSPCASTSTASAQINVVARTRATARRRSWRALEEVFARDHAARDGLRLQRHVVPGEGRAAGRAARASIFGLSLLVVFLILAAQYESWSLPFSVLLGTPIAVFGAFARALAARLREQRLRADRARHADRPRREERDPDRRVREARVRAGQDRRRRRAGRRAAAPAARS